jgi:hypothetical protein
MGLPIIGDVITAVKDLVSEVVVDKDKRIEINYKLQELEDKANQRLHEEMMGQIAVNTEEAKHQSIFVAGWRPAVGWIGATSLGYSFILNPFMEFISRVNGYAGNFPELPMEYIMTIMMGMLGFGGLRTWEKVKGVQTDTTQKTSTPTTKVETTGDANVEVSVDGNTNAPVKPKSKNIFKQIGKLL